jgi:hypothetical protein
MIPLLGLAALIWFLVRVVPKPRRATYPCQRVAAPLASGFLAWLASTVASVWAMRQGKACLRRERIPAACLCFALAGAAFVAMLASMDLPPARAAAVLQTGPIGTPQGIHPGRVVWVHDPDATDWAGYTSPEPWFASNHTDAAVVARMVAQAVRGVAGQATDAAAWEALFRSFNARHGKGATGYDPGEKVMIKLNLTTCNDQSDLVDRTTYRKKSGGPGGGDTNWVNTIDNSPQMVHALLDQLVHTAGVAQTNITVGDPTALFPKYLWDALRPDFPDVHIVDNYGGSGRERASFSDIPLCWSTTDAEGKIGDTVPDCFAAADYVINCAVLKTHGEAGITGCAKNHFGSFIRCPNGYLRDLGYLNFYDVHGGGVAAGTGRYRPQVDLLGHPDIGGKTLLCFIDGLFSGTDWASYPHRWSLAPFGSGGSPDWPSSLFASLDPVAIDSVAFDFWLAERPDLVAPLAAVAEDSLVEAALAGNPPSGSLYDPAGDGSGLASLGVYEHWNNATDKQYSRNLGTGAGIELVRLSSRTSPRLTAAAASTNGVELEAEWLIPGAVYGIEIGTSLAENAWSPGGTVTAATERTTWTLQAAGARTVYYRLNGR